MKLEGDISHVRNSTKSHLRELRDLINQRFDGVETEVCQNYKGKYEM